MKKGKSLGGVGSRETEGGRGPTGVSSGAEVGAGPLVPGQRLSLGRKREVDLRMLRGGVLGADVGAGIGRIEFGD